MTPRPSPASGPKRRPFRDATLLLGGLLAAGTLACEVEWGEARIRLEDPSPPADTTGRATETEPAPLPLPEGPFLWAVRLEADGSARAVPMARLDSVEGTLSAIEWPEDGGGGYRARFDSTFLASGTELALLAGGERIGSLVLEGPAEADGGAGGAGAGAAGPCPSVTAAVALLVAGQTTPELAFALPTALVRDPPRGVPRPAPVRAMTVAGPVLAERLIDDPRAYLARRVALSAVRLPGDSVPAMAATYLVNDSLSAAPPPGEAISLFFMARYEPGRGYVPFWQAVERYGSEAGKRILVYEDWIRAPGSRRIDFVRVVDVEGVRLGAVRMPEGGPVSGSDLDWTEGACGALDLLAPASGATAAAGSGGPVARTRSEGGGAGGPAAVSAAAGTGAAGGS